MWGLGIEQICSDYSSLGLLYIGPDGSVDVKANPWTKWDCACFKALLL